MEKKIGPVLFFLVVLIFPLCLTATVEGYVIGDEDMLQISVWGNQELSVQVPVRPDGMVSFPLVGDVKATGVTPQELKAVIERELVKFIKTPTVSVMVTSVNSFKVYVIGEGVGAAAPAAEGAGRSGVITLRRNTTLMQLLAQLGSLRGADLNSAYLLRDGRRIGVDFFKLMSKGDVSQDVQLKPNDIIFIPDNFDRGIRVVGAVRTPGIIQYREGMTALDAVLNAGGFTDFAKQNDVVVVRKSGGEVQNIEVRLKDVIRDGDMSKNVALKPGDHVIVKSGLF
jgi:polysaccharide export outer membrane protein